MSTITERALYPIPEAMALLGLSLDPPRLFRICVS